MSFTQGPGLSEQYWWEWSNTLRFVFLKQGRWIMVTSTDHDLQVQRKNLHLKDRFVDLTRITSNKTKS